MGNKKVFLSIAGSDPSGGAGIQADIKTAVSIGLYPASVVTTITAQNTTGFYGMWNVSGEILRAQMEAVLQDMEPDAVKIGLLHSVESVEIIAEVFSKYTVPKIVIDPVFSPTLFNGRPDSDLIASIVKKLFPLATLVTPNILEKDIIEQVVGCTIDEICEAWLVKGGHKDGDDCTDTLYYHQFENPQETFQSTAFPSINNSAQPFFPHDAYSFNKELLNSRVIRKEYKHKRIKTTNTHGTGCILSSAVACFLAKDYNLGKAVDKAESFTIEALNTSLKFNPGKGNYGPVLV